VEQKEDEMNRRSNHYLTILLCAVITANAACSTTTQRLGPSQAAMNHHGLANGDTVLVRYANEDDARSSSSSEQIRIAGIDESGISGIGETGEAVNVGYDEIFQIEYIKVGSIKSDSPAIKRVGKAADVTSKVLIKGLVVAVCLAAATGGGAC